MRPIGRLANKSGCCGGGGGGGGIASPNQASKGLPALRAQSPAEQTDWRRSLCAHSN